MAQESVLRVGVDSRPAVDGSAKGKEALRDLGAQAKRTETDFDSLSKSMASNTSQIVAKLSSIDSKARTTQGHFKALTEAVRQGSWTNASGFNQLATAIDRIGDEAAETNRQLLTMKASSTGAASSFGGLRNVLLGVGLFEVARRFAQMSDAATNMDNRLRLVTKTTAEMNAVYAQLLTNSNAVGVTIQDSVQLYSRLSVGTRELGMSYRDVIDLTNRLNQAMIISGGSTSEGAAALRQLGQALGKNQLNGDELVSILENSQKISQVIADGMGVPVGALKELGAQGKITAKDIVDAFRKAGPELDEEMAKVAPTIERSLNVVQNRVVGFFKMLNENGVGKAISRSILFIADNFDILALAVAGVGVALVASLIPGMIAASAAFLATPVGWVTVALAAAGAALAVFGRTSFTVAGQTASGWEWIKATILTVWEGGIKPVLDWFSGALETLAQKVNGFAGTTGSAFDLIWKFAKAYSNFIIGAWVFAFGTIKNIWSNLPGALNAFFVGAVNLGITAVERLVNSWRSGLIMIANLVRVSNPGIASGINALLNATGPLQLDRMQNNAAGAAFNTAQNENARSAFGTDYIGNATGAIAGNLGRVRNSAGTDDSVLDNEYGGSGNTMPEGADKNSGRNRETAAQMLERFTREQTNAIAVAQRYYTVSAAQAELDKMNEEYHKRFGEFIAPTEASALLVLAQRKQDELDMQRTRDGILKAAIEPQREYARGLRAIAELTADHAISAEDAAVAMRQVRMAYLETKRDVASGVELGFLKIDEDLSQKAARVASAIQGIFNDVRGPAIAYEAHMIAVNALHERGAITATEYAARVRDIQISYLDTQTTFEAGWSRAILKVQRDMADASQAIETAITNAFKNAEDALLDFLDTGKLDLHSFFDDLWKDMARGQIREHILSPIASMMGKFGVNIPGLEDKLGTAGNPMHVVMGANDNSPTSWLDTIMGRTQDEADATDATTADWFSKVRIGFENCWSVVRDGLNLSVSGFGSLFSSIANWISNLSSGGGGGNIFSTLLNAGMALFGGGGGGVPADLIGLFAEGGYSNAPVKRMPAYAEGTANTSGGFQAILHDNEAVVPLSRGRSIPVEMRGANDGGGDTYVFEIDARGSEAGVEQAIGRVLAEVVPQILTTARTQSREDLKSLARQKI